MENATLNVTGMTCQGCVASVTRVLKAVPGVSRRRRDAAARHGDGRLRRDPDDTAGAEGGDRGRRV